MLPTRREIILSAPVLPTLALPPLVGDERINIAQIVRRLEQLSVERDALFDLHAEPLGAAMAAGEGYHLDVAPIEEECQRLVQQLIQMPARTSLDLRLKAKVVGWYNAFPDPQSLCPADALVRSLLIDLDASA